MAYQKVKRRKNAKKIKDALTGRCKCGETYIKHRRCKKCAILIHKDPQFCKMEGSTHLTGYVPTGNVCYNCKQDAKQKRLKDPEYQLKLAAQRIATRKYRAKHLDEMRIKEKAIAKKNQKKRWLARKMKLLSDPAARVKRIYNGRNFTKKHPGYHKEANRFLRSQNLVYNESGQRVQLIYPPKGRKVPLSRLCSEGDSSIAVLTLRRTPPFFHKVRPRQLYKPVLAAPLQGQICGVRVPKAKIGQARLRWEVHPVYAAVVGPREVEITLATGENIGQE